MVTKTIRVSLEAYRALKTAEAAANQRSLCYLASVLCISLKNSFFRVIARFLLLIARAYMNTNLLMLTGWLRLGGSIPPSLNLQL